MATQFSDLVRDKFDYDSEGARSLFRSPWLDEHLAKRKAEQTARETEAASQAAQAAQQPAAAPQEDSALLPGKDIKDPYHPANFFSQTNIGRSTVEERAARTKEWMKSHSANFLTPSGLAAFKSEAARKAPDNAFGLASKETTTDNVKDVGLSLGQGVVGSVEAITSIFGADNGASKWLNTVKDKLGDYKSAASKIDSAAMQAKIKEMEASGSTVGEIKAYFNAFLEQPAEMIAQGIGSFATLGVGKVAQGVGLGAKAVRAVNIGTGAIQGIGGAKSQQYESVKALAKEQGKTEAEAEALAVKAQEYSPENFVRLGVAGVLGAIASGTGVESALFGKAATGGLLARGVKGFAKEAIPEAAQEGQSKEAANDAAIRAGVLDESKRFQGVAGSAVQAGVIGGILGGGVDVVSGGAPTYKPATTNVAPQATNTPATATDTSVAQDAAKPVATPTILPSYEKARVENVGAVQKAFKEVASLSGTDEEVATKTSAIVGALAPEQRAEYERVAAAGHTVSDNGTVLTKEGTPIPVFEAQADHLPYQLLESEVAIKNAAEKIDAATSPAMRTAAINAAKATLGKDIFIDRFSDVGEVKNVDGLNANLKSLWEALPEIQKAKNEPTQTPTQSPPAAGLPGNNSPDGAGAGSPGSVSGGDNVAGSSDKTDIRPSQQAAGSVAQSEVSYADQTTAQIVLDGYKKNPNAASLVELQATAKSLGITNTGVKSKKQVAAQIKEKLANLDIQAQAEDQAFEQYREQQIIDAGPPKDSIKYARTTTLGAKNETTGNAGTAATESDVKALIRATGLTAAFGSSPAYIARPINTFLMDGRVLNDLAKVLGTKIAGIALNPVLTPAQRKEIPKFDGAFLNNTIFIQQGADRPNLAVLGHEFGHKLRADSPALYDALVLAIQPYIDQKGYAEFLKTAVAKNEKTDSAKHEEFIGEVFSDGFMDKKFWQTVGEANPSLLASVVSKLKSLIDYIKARTPSSPRMDKYLTDYDQVMRLAANTLAKFEAQASGQPANLALTGTTDGQSYDSTTNKAAVQSLSTFAARPLGTTTQKSSPNDISVSLSKQRTSGGKVDTTRSYSVLNDTFATQGAQATLDAIAAKGSAFDKDVIAAIRPFVESVTLSETAPANTADGTLGLYMPNSRKIWLGPNASAHTVLHELVHAAVDTIMHTNINSLTQRQQMAVRTLTKLHAFASANPRFAGRYANTDVHEFIAEAMSNQDFQVALNEMSVEQLFSGAPTSMWDKFKDAIANVLGINNNTLKSSLLTTRALLNDLLSAPIDRQSESLALIGTTRQVIEQKKNNLWRRATEKMSTAFVDHGTRGLNQLMDARDEAATPELKKATENLRQTYILQDPSGARERLTTAIALPIEEKIIELAKTNGLDANELRHAASEVTIAEHSLDMSKKRQAEIDELLADAQATVDGYEVIENLKPEFKTKVKKQVAAIDTLYMKAAIVGSIVDTENINDAVLKLEEILDEFAAQVAIGGGKEVITAKAKQMIKQSVRRAKSPQGLHTFQSDSRRLINAAYLVSLEFGTILEGKAGAERLFNQHDQESKNWYAAQTQDPTADTSGVLRFAGAYKLPAGMQMKQAQQILTNNAADKDAALVNEVAEMYRQGFRELDKEAVKLNIKSEEDVEKQTMEYPFYVNTQGQGTTDPETNITETASRGFMSKAEGADYYNSNDIFSNLNLRIQKLAQVDASAKLAEAAGEYVAAGGKLLVPFNPHDGKAKKNYIIQRSKAYEPIYYAATTPELDGMFGSKPVAQEALQTVGRVTRGYGQLFTQATLAFAPLGYVRESMTRTFNLRGYADELVRPDGSRVSVAEARSRMITQFLNPSNLGVSIRAAWGGAETDEMAEFAREGGLQTFSDMLRTEAQVSAKFNASALSKGFAGIKKIIHKYNQGFETAAVLASYRALKQSGMAPRQAAFITLSMMNFRRSGNLTAQYLQPFYMFVNANLQDTRQLMKVVVDRNGKINKAGVAEVAFMAGAAYMIFGMLREASDDDELGGKEMDALSTREKTSSINIGGVKIPLGFGFPQTSYAIGVYMHMADLGQISHHEAAMESLSAIMKNFVPTGLSESGIRKDPGTAFIQTLLPDLLAPIQVLASGKNFMGSPVTGKLDETKFKAEQGKWKTPEWYKDAASNIQKTTGFDLAPEELKAITDGYLAGPLAFAAELMIGAEADKADKGRDNLDSPAAWERAIGISRWVYKSNEAKSVVQAFYVESNKMSPRMQELNSDSPFAKTGKSEDFESKMTRFAEAGATPEEINSFRAKHAYDKTSRELKQESTTLYARWKAGEAVEADMAENARREIEAQKQFVLDTRGIL